MRKLFLLALLLCFALPSLAQDNEPTPYEIALQRIREAEASGATNLDLAELGLTELPPEIGNLSNLQILDLRLNSLSSLPPEIGNLSNLKGLYIQVNVLNSLPPEIGNLTNLQDLNLFDNQLSSLPSEIGNLSNLQFLVLIDNQLSSLLSEIGSLSNLCVLDITANRFESIPLELYPLKRLGNLEGCPLPSGLWIDEQLLENLPEAVQQGGTLAILDYLENETLWHLKRLILGAATSFGVFAAVILGIRWRGRGKGKKKRE